jgi:hypothetical protein
MISEIGLIRVMGFYVYAGGLRISPRLAKVLAQKGEKELLWPHQRKHQKLLYLYTQILVHPTQLLAAPDCTFVKMSLHAFGIPISLLEIGNQ